MRLELLDDAFWSLMTYSSALEWETSPVVVNSQAMVKV